MASRRRQGAVGIRENRRGFGFVVPTDPDGHEDLFIAEGPRVRKVSPNGIITTVAGNGMGGDFYSGDGGPATSAEVAPNGVAVDGSGDLFIANANMSIRKGGSGKIRGHNTQKTANTTTARETHIVKSITLKRAAGNC